jgi:hypothetical protein
LVNFSGFGIMYQEKSGNPAQDLNAAETLYVLVLLFSLSFWNLSVVVSIYICSVFF